MAYKIGYANGHKDLLMALKGFLENAKMAHNIAADVGNTGDGYVSAERCSTTPVDETWTLTATSATNFTVTGSVSGAQAAATVGTPYDNGIVAFTIIAGDTAFVATDEFTFDVAEGLGATENYTVKSWDDDYDEDGEYELILMGPGTGGDDEIYTGIQTYYDVGGDYYNWRMQGYSGYSAAVDFNNQPGAISTSTNYIPKILLWNSKIPYWFVANGRRFIVVAKVSTVYETLYMGFLMPYGLPNQYPYPLVIGGTCRAYNADEKRWSTIEAEHRGWPDPFRAADGSTLMIMHNATWLGCGNWSGNTELDFSSYRNVWPFMHTDYYDTSPLSDKYNPNSFWRYLQMNIDGTYPLLPLIVCGDMPNDNFYGELQGAFAVPGLDLNTEDTITINGDTYVVFQNTFRNDNWEFWTLKLE